MTDIVRQVIPLVGVLVGALATYLVTAANERDRWRRNRADRWDESRKEAYVEYGQAVKRWAYLSCRVAAARGFDHSADPMPPEEGIPALAAAETERGSRWESVLLLGAPATVAAARAWHVAVHRLEWYARGKLTDASAWEPAIHEADSARDRFYEAARRDLGITSGTLPPPHWPPTWAVRPDGSD